MKEWVKETIKQEPVSFLTLRNVDNIQILPFVYKYVKGKLISSISIIQAKEIATLRSNPYQYLTIPSEEYQLGILGQIVIKDSNIDEDWKSYPSILQELTDDISSANLQSLPHLHKAVLIEFIPVRIDYSDGETTDSLSMEIVI